MFVMLCATPTSLQSDRIISMLIAVTNLEEEEVCVWYKKFIRKVLVPSVSLLIDGD